MGGLTGKGGPRTQTTTQTNRVTMPDWLSQAYEGAAGSAANLYGQGGAGVVPYSQPTLAGLTTTQNLAMDPSRIPGYAQSFQNFQDTLGGKYLHGGEGFTAALDAAQADIMPRVKSAFNRGGRTSGGLAQAAMAEELGNVFGSMYQTERGRQQQAMGMAPGMYNLAMAPAQSLMGVGSALESKQQQQAQQPTQALNAYLSQLGPIGATLAAKESTMQQPIYNSGGSGLLGTALSLAPMFFGGGGLGLGLGGMGSVGNLANTTGTFNLFPSRLNI